MRGDITSRYLVETHTKTVLPAFPCISFVAAGNFLTDDLLLLHERHLFLPFPLFPIDRLSTTPTMEIRVYGISFVRREEAWKTAAVATGVGLNPTLKFKFLHLARIDPNANFSFKSIWLILSKRRLTEMICQTVVDMYKETQKLIEKDKVKIIEVLGLESRDTVLLSPYPFTSTCTVFLICNQPLLHSHVAFKVWSCYLLLPVGLHSPLSITCVSDHSDERPPSSDHYRVADCYFANTGFAEKCTWNYNRDRTLQISIKKEDYKERMKNENEASHSQFELLSMTEIPTITPESLSPSKDSFDTSLNF
ncbi:hypothetical protein LXL04_029806 [Taraxacum kok-saghyz]